MPALFTRMSSRPNRSTVSVTIVGPLALVGDVVMAVRSTDRSSARARALRPRRRARRRSSTFAPSAANSRASAAPCPRAPPLISATLPSSRPMGAVSTRLALIGWVPMPSWSAVDETPKEACGVFGVYAPGQHVAHLTYLGLYALQHRGQESAGMAVSDGHSLTVVKDMGLVSNAFDDRTLAGAHGLRRDRPHPLLDDGLEHVAQRAARVPRRRPARVRARPQRQPREHRSARRRGRHVAGHGHVGQRPHRGAARARARARRTTRCATRRTKSPLVRRAERGAAASRGRVLARARRRRARHRRARPERLPPVVPRPSRRRAGCSRPSRRRSTSSAPTSSASSIPARWS